MLFYYQCPKCDRRSDLLKAEECPTTLPACPNPDCAKAPKKPVVKKKTNVFVMHCRRCDRTSSLQSDSTYEAIKAAGATCNVCAGRDEVVLLPPSFGSKPKRVEKRKTPGILGKRDEDQLPLYDKDLEEARFQPWKKRKLEKRLELATTPPTPVVYESDSEVRKVARIEARYRQGRSRQKEYTRRFGALTDTQDPLKTELHVGRVVPLTSYRSSLSNSETIGGKSFPKLSKSAPTLVNAARIVGRETTWDYRELGPNSLLRRLCSLLYTLELGSGGVSNNPIELQAMWAAGSLFLSSNNYSYNLLLLGELKSAGSLRGLIKAMKPIDAAASAHQTLKTVARNFGKEHLGRLELYKADFLADTYKEYFHFKWSSSFDDLRACLAWDATTMTTVTIVNAVGGYTAWTLKEGSVAPGKIYLVMPQAKAAGVPEGTYFKKKEIHAEELFYPILTWLKTQLKITPFGPAFVGGVKTPCRTCFEVMKAASTLLGSKLILSTNAKGHYWKASAQHVPGLTFDEREESMVFGNDTSKDNQFNTEMPPSPDHE